MMAKTAFFVGTLASILSAESLVLAQVRSAAAQPAAPAPAPAPAPAAAPAPPPPAPAPAPEPVAAPAVTPPSAAATPPPADEVPDHERFVGHIGLTYFDIANLPIAVAPTAGNPTPDNGSVSAPIIGARIWLGRNIGIDAGLGFGIQGGSHTVDNGVQSTTTNEANPFGVGLHGGIPIALAHYRHYSFLVVPEVTVGFTSASEQQMGAPDINRNGTLIELGARAGAEIHFGFIGIPELALQATVGAFFDAAFTKVTMGPASFSRTATSLTTTVGGAPWAIFTNNISATYYL